MVRTIYVINNASIVHISDGLMTPQTAVKSKIGHEQSLTCQLAITQYKF